MLDGHVCISDNFTVIRLTVRGSNNERERDRERSEIIIHTVFRQRGFAFPAIIWQAKR